MSMVDIFDEEINEMTKEEIIKNIEWEEYYLNSPEHRYKDAYMDNLERLNKRLSEINTP